MEYFTVQKYLFWLWNRQCKLNLWNSQDLSASHSVTWGQSCTWALELTHNPTWPVGNSIDFLSVLGYGDLSIKRWSWFSKMKSLQIFLDRYQDNLEENGQQSSRHSTIQRSHFDPIAQIIFFLVGCYPIMLRENHIKKWSKLSHLILGSKIENFTIISEHITNFYNDQIWKNTKRFRFYKLSVLMIF